MILPQRHYMMLLTTVPPTMCIQPIEQGWDFSILVRIFNKPEEHIKKERALMHSLSFCMCHDMNLQLLDLIMCQSKNL